MRLHNGLVELNANKALDEIIDVTLNEAMLAEEIHVVYG